jgi:hypothetical protein
MTKKARTIIGWTVWLTLAGVAITIAIVSSVHADHVAQHKHDFQVVCEFQGGHIATLDEGESYVCIKGGKVIDRD